mmetsp:Transcript_68430/g.190878  ORF Transcript_68430/g.190878 Transcript_68430/m.190878 type:complete len:301 (-) Transcript_68430:215-1117(-)
MLLLGALALQRLLRLAELRRHVRGEGGRRRGLDVAEALLPIPKDDLALEGPPRHHLSVFQCVHRQRAPSRQRHVVGLVGAFLGLPDTKLHGHVLQPLRLPATCIHLGGLDADLLRHRLWDVVAFVQSDVAEARLRIEELQGSRVAEVLAADEVLFGVDLVLHGDLPASRQRDLLRTQSETPLRTLHSFSGEAKLHLHVLLQRWEAVVGLDALPIHVKGFATGYKSLLVGLDEAIPFELRVVRDGAHVPRLPVELEILRERGRLLAAPTPALAATLAREDLAKRLHHPVGTPARALPLAGR